jgi:hypothetical protein
MRRLIFRIFTDVTAPEGFTIHDGKDVVKIETENLPESAI